jgi:CIC family chloride channel protein
MGEPATPPRRAFEVPRIESVLREEGQLDSPLVLPVKFVGGAAAIGAGLALGREGPTVQMGAAAAQLVARAFRMGPGDIRSLIAAGSGAGLAAAFGAPLSGTVFVLEELVQRFDLRVLVATLTACSAGIAVCYELLGTRPVFLVPVVAAPGFFHFVFYLALGVPLGVLGVAYNRMIVRGLDLTDRFTGARSELCAMAIGAVIGLLGWFIPDTLGSGEEQVQHLLQSGGKAAVPVLLALLVVRFVVGPISYAARTPGGLFAPLLVVGAMLGTVCGTLVHRLAPGQLPDPTALTIVGMAGFFAATVRAPITGVTLTLELTAVSSLFVPMLATCAVAAAVPTLLGDPPIYDALRARARHRSGAVRS